VLLHKLDTTDYSCLVLPRTLTNRRHRFLCFLRAAQLPSQDCVCSPVLLVQYSRVHRSATSATVVFRGGKPAHRKVCWLASYACSHQGIHRALCSQQCRKSEYLKPRITTYDSSCRCIHLSCARLLMKQQNSFGLWFLVTTTPVPLSCTLYKMQFTVEVANMTLLGFC